MPASRKKQRIDPADTIANATCGDLRRMYRLGEILQRFAEEDSDFRAKMTDMLDRSLKREEDRALFGLSPKRPSLH